MAQNSEHKKIELKSSVDKNSTLPASNGRVVAVGSVACSNETSSYHPTCSVTIIYYNSRLLNNRSRGTACMNGS